MVFIIFTPRPLLQIKKYFFTNIFPFFVKKPHVSVFDERKRIIEKFFFTDTSSKRTPCKSRVLSIHLFELLAVELPLRAG